MPIRLVLPITVAICVSLLVGGCAGEREETAPPNIIFILADDLGYGELGTYGQDLIETPNLDALAAEGMRFTQHYSGAPVCAPARATLMTGMHTGHAYIRGNDEWAERGDVWNYEAMFENPYLEGQRPIPDSVVTIAEVLRSAGYATGMVGKWGLGAPTTEGVPNRQGFDMFFGYNCQRQAHTYYPKHLWKNEERLLLNNDMVAPHTPLAEGADPNNPASYAAYELSDYAPDLMHNAALDFIADNKDQPFFLYYASPIPHVPLQAPERWVAYYQEKLGPEPPYAVGNYYPNRTPRATYAAMISYLDEQVGDVVSLLEDLGIDERTLVIFTSDNGPTYAGGADAEYFASAEPFQTVDGRIKGTVYEGGIRVPMIAKWPGIVLPGTESDLQSAFYDFFPTLAEVAGAAVPIQTDGISLLPELSGQQQLEHEFLYWEFPAYNGQQAVRLGKWKGIRKDIFDGNLTIALYDLDADPREERDLSDQHPDIVAQIESVMLREHVPAAIERFRMTQIGD